MKTKKLFTFALVMVLICTFAFGFNTTVKATTTLNDLENSGDITKTSNGDGSYTLKVNKLTQIALEISRGEKVTLDLNGQTLMNVADDQMPTITVDEGAELTIKNSGESTGMILRNPGAIGVGQPVIRNKGILNITSGMIYATEQSQFGIENDAGGKLNISGGQISVAAPNVSGIFNYQGGEVNITDGYFNQGKIPGAETNYPMISNQGKLTITGGTFINTTGNKMPSIANIGQGDVKVTGGKFVYQDPNNNFAQENQDMSTLMPDNYELDSNGNVVEKQEPTTKPTETTTKPAEQSTTTTKTVKEETTTTKAETKSSTNPKTLDNILAYVGLAIMSLSAVGYAGYKVRRKVNN